jgi:hypothetical protein
MTTKISIDKCLRLLSWILASQQTPNIRAGGGGGPDADADAGWGVDRSTASLFFWGGGEGREGTVVQTALYLMQSQSYPVCYDEGFRTKKKKKTIVDFVTLSGALAAKCPPGSNTPGSVRRHFKSHTRVMIY